jgi:SEC-C motif
MELDNPEPDVNATSTAGAEPGDVTPEEAAPDAPDPAALVARLIDSSEWPDPELVAQIVAAGEAALEPLLAFIRTYPQEYERESALYNGVDILGMIGSPTVIPELVEVIRRYPEDSGELAAEVLGEFGPSAFEPALELVRDPNVVDYPRRHAIRAARRAAGADPALRARLAELLRPMLADAMERTRADMRARAAEPPDEDEDDDESEGSDREDLDEAKSSEDDEALLDVAAEESPEEEVAPESYVEGLNEIEAQPLEPYEEVMFLVGDLAALADPEARELIKTAFAEDLVDTYWTDEKFVEKQYREGGEKPRPPRDRLEDYRDRHKKHIEYLNRPPAPTRPLYQADRRSSYSGPPTEVAPLPPQEPIRRTGPKLGRNDPCWCGSGKKYKKCHLGKDDSK